MRKREVLDDTMSDDVDELVEPDTEEPVEVVDITGGDPSYHYLTTFARHPDLLVSYASDIDKRKQPVRRSRELITQMIADRGGFANVTEIELQMIRIIAFNLVRLEQVREQAIRHMAKGEDIPKDVEDLLDKLHREFRATAGRLGFGKRTPRDITPQARDDDDDLVAPS